MKDELEFELSYEEYIKKLERLKRDKNTLELEKKKLVRDLANEKAKHDFLIKRERTLQTVESYLLQRINKLKVLNHKEYDIAVIELEKLSEALDYERALANGEIKEEEE